MVTRLNHIQLSQLLRLPRFRFLLSCNSSQRRRINCPCAYRRRGNESNFIGDPFVRSFNERSFELRAGVALVSGAPQTAHKFKRGATELYPFGKRRHLICTLITGDLPFTALIQSKFECESRMFSPPWTNLCSRKPELVVMKDSKWFHTLCIQTERRASATTRDEQR
ncbi:hypothetical protein EVAR_38642_1 [Eumeta japonica]|uniref:Uncharacterized protein n=1 Tax=Eumeta variegata TaxID=151549 RepID=A0A4C1XXT4_EUMVA|nr:hypothetical protein EVAR_38642_1 [Eumeta japonica]